MFLTGIKQLDYLKYIFKIPETAINVYFIGGCNIFRVLPVLILLYGAPYTITMNDTHLYDTHHPVPFTIHSSLINTSKENGTFL